MHCPGSHPAASNGVVSRAVSQPEGPRVNAMLGLAALCLATLFGVAACSHAPSASGTSAQSVVASGGAVDEAVVKMPELPAPDAPVVKTKVPVLMYHHVKDRAPGVGSVVLRYSVAPKDFDAQMKWLHDNGYTSISFQQLADHITRGIELPAKPIIISIDDGWSCGYFAAFKSLKAHGLTATYFVYPGGINAGNAGGYISWDQLREMADAGMEIGDHTISHPYLTQMPADAAWREISESKKTLEQKLARPVLSIAYPFGDYNDAIMEMARRAGYTCGVSTDPGNEHGLNELFRLCRIIVTYGEPTEQFARDVSDWQATPKADAPTKTKSEPTPPKAPERPRS